MRLTAPGDRQQAKEKRDRECSNIESPTPPATDLPTSSKLQPLAHRLGDTP
jgi:hypothetical protein